MSQMCWVSESFLWLCQIENKGLMLQLMNILDQGFLAKTLNIKEYHAFGSNL